MFTQLMENQLKTTKGVILPGIDKQYILKA